jgi:23S rRNA pseudouridine1911/1915/1917 synthase
LARASEKPAAGELIRVEPPETAPARLAAEEIPLRIIYDDESLLVVDKPAGLTVHPGAGTPSGTLVNTSLDPDRFR